MTQHLASQRAYEVVAASQMSLFRYIIIFTIRTSRSRPPSAPRDMFVWNRPSSSGVDTDYPLGEAQLVSLRGIQGMEGRKMMYAGVRQNCQ